MSYRVNKLERQILYNIAYMWNLENNGINALIGKTEIVIDIENKLVVTKVGLGQTGRLRLMYIHYYV